MNICSGYFRLRSNELNMVTRAFVGYSCSDRRNGLVGAVRSPLMPIGASGVSSRWLKIWFLPFYRLLVGETSKFSLIIFRARF